MDNVLRDHPAWVMSVIVLLFWVIVAAVSARNLRRPSFGIKGYGRSRRTRIKTLR